MSARDMLTQTVLKLEMTGSPCLCELFLAIVIARSTLLGWARSRFDCEKLDARDLIARKSAGEVRTRDLDFNCEKVPERGSNP